ncbi:hypothetical protein AA0K91_22930, partial [Burkholderia multivorans]|uniref:hypothetical protein n=1 Tax=Burkholderia multivorans TaxID=87883 RepID=UPI003F81562C
PPGAGVFLTHRIPADFFSPIAATWAHSSDHFGRPPHGAGRSGPVGQARSLRGIPVFFRIFFEITDDILAPRCAPLRARFLIPPVARVALRARRRRRT